MIGVGTFKTSERARLYVNQVLDSQRLSYGPFIQKFEKVFASAHQCRFAIMSNSGTSSLLVALAALKEKYGWKDGDEVVVPAVTFVATSNIVLQLNMKPVFVDVEPDYYGINPELLESVITERTKCIIPVHLFGMPCDMRAILEVADKYQLRIIEDSCETMFAQHHGQSVGSFGDVGCFSTYVAHLLTTGVGGLCTTNDPELAVIIRSLVNHGRDSIYLSIDDDKGKTAEELDMIIDKRFSFVRMGYSFRVTELEGALGLAQIEDSEDMLLKRRFNASFFTKSLSSLNEKIQLPAIRDGADHSFMMYPIVLKNEHKKDLVRYLEVNGIETRDMLPLVNQPFYAEQLNVNEDDFPVAKWINNSGFYIASHQDLTQSMREHIVEVIHSYFESRAISTEKASLIVMSKLSSQKYDALGIQSFLEALPVSEFDDLILADAINNQPLVEKFSDYGFSTFSMKGVKSELLHEAIKRAKCEYIVVIGLDGTDNVNDITSMLHELRKGYDLVIASRFVQGGQRAYKGWLTNRSFGNRFFAFLVSMMFKRNISDTNNLFRAFRRSSVLNMNFSKRTEEVMFEMTVRMLGEDMRISELPTEESPLMFQISKRSRFCSAFSFFLILLRQLKLYNRK